jgi:hypothetical protein
LMCTGLRVRQRRSAKTRHCTPIPGAYHLLWW